MMDAKQKKPSELELTAQAFDRMSLELKKNFRTQNREIRELTKKSRSRSPQRAGGPCATQKTEDYAKNSPVRLALDAVQESASQLNLDSIGRSSAAFGKMHPEFRTGITPAAASEGGSKSAVEPAP